MNGRAAHSQRGQSLPFIAVLLLALTGVVGLSVDVGYYRYNQRIEQTAADSAALAGASELAFSTQSAQDAAQADAAKNGFVNGSNGTIVTVNTNYTDSFTGTSNAVRVTVSKSYPNYFGVVFGSGNVTVTTTAVARMVSNDAACLYQLNPASSPNFSNVQWNGPGCGMLLNGSPNFTSATVDASEIGYAGGSATTTGATFTQATPAPSLPVADPCPQIPGCNYLADNPPSTTTCVSGSYSKQSVTLTPGCYGNMNFNGANVTLEPGLYVINGAWNLNGSTYSGTGVTLYGTSIGCVNFDNATLNLTPPTSGNTAGVLIYQSPETTSSSCAPNFNGSSDSVSGLIYYPSVSVNLNGALGSYTTLVVGNVNFNSGTQTFASPPPGGSFVEEPRLAE